MSDGYFLNGVELLDFRREPIVAYPDKVQPLKIQVRSSGKRKPIGPGRRAALFERDGHNCHYCKRTMTAPDGISQPLTMRTVDHIVPLSKGGSNRLYNLVYACYKCNSQFGDIMVKCGCNICITARSIMGLATPT